MSPWLAFDAASPNTSAAIADRGGILAASSGASRSGPSLLQQIESCVATWGRPVTELSGIVALTGPGSFTGIRITLATAIGLRSGLTVPVFGLSHLAALALAEPERSGPIVCSLVDALRDEWFLQLFERSPQLAAGWRPASPPERRPAADLELPEGTALTLHEGANLPAHLAGHPQSRVGALAPAVARAAAQGRNADLLTPDLAPLYLRGFTPR